MNEECNAILNALVDKSNNAKANASMDYYDTLRGLTPEQREEKATETLTKALEFDPIYEAEQEKK